MNWKNWHGIVVWKHDESDKNLVINGVTGDDVDSFVQNAPIDEIEIERLQRTSSFGKFCVVRYKVFLLY